MSMYNISKNSLPDCNNLQLRAFMRLKSCFLHDTMNFLSSKLYGQHLKISEDLALAVFDISVWKEGIPWAGCLFYNEGLSLSFFLNL